MGRVPIERFDMAKKYHNSQGALITEDKSKKANLPQSNIIRNFPELPTGGYSNYNDNITGIDSKIRGDIKNIRRNNKVGNW